MINNCHRLVRNKRCSFLVGEVHGFECCPHLGLVDLGYFCNLLKITPSVAVISISAIPSISGMMGNVLLNKGLNISISGQTFQLIPKCKQGVVFEHLQGNSKMLSVAGPPCKDYKGECHQITLICMWVQTLDLSKPGKGSRQDEWAVPLLTYIKVF